MTAPSGDADGEREDPRVGLLEAESGIGSHRTWTMAIV